MHFVLAPPCSGIWGSSRSQCPGVLGADVGHGQGRGEQGKGPTFPRYDPHGHLVGTRWPPHVSLQVVGCRDPSKRFLKDWSIRRQPPVEGVAAPLWFNSLLMPHLLLLLSVFWV